MADRDGKDAAEKIEIFFALDVPHVLHRAVIRHQRLLIKIRRGGPDIFLVLANHLFAAGRLLGLGRHYWRSFGTTDAHGLTRMKSKTQNSKLKTKPLRARSTNLKSVAGQ